MSPGLTRWLGSFIVRGPSETAPSPINCWSRERVNSLKAAARNRSSRQPAWPSSAAARRFDPSTEDTMPEPLSDMLPETPPAGIGHKAAWIAVIILSALIILAVIALVVGGIAKS